MSPITQELHQGFPEEAEEADDLAMSASCGSGISSEPDIAPTAAGLSQVNWPELVERIQRGDDAGMTELYAIFAKGIRFFLCRQLGPQELDDRVHDTFLIVVQAIQRGDLREPERLMGFVRTVVRRQVAAQIDKVVHHRREEVDLELGSMVPDKRFNPEQTVAFRQRVEMMENIL